MLGEGAADVTRRPVAVVGEHLDEDRDATLGIAFIDDGLVVRALGPARASLDRALHVVIGHAGFAGPLDGRTEPRVPPRVPAALTRCDGDLARELAEELPAHEIHLLLPNLDVMPLGMSRHREASQGDLGQLYQGTGNREQETAVCSPFPVPLPYCSVTVNVAVDCCPSGATAVSVMMYFTPLTRTEGRNR